MATQIQVGDILAVRAWNHLSDQAAVNTFNFACIASTGAGVTDQDLADGFAPFFATFYTTYMANGATHDGVQVYFMRRTAGFSLPAPVDNTVSAGGGTAGADALPKNTAAILKYTTNVRGPAGRGRVFLPFASTAATTPFGVPTAALNTLINGLASTLLTPTIVGTVPNQSTLVWSLLHRDPVTKVITTTELLSAATAFKFGQMHKRGDYGRPNASPI